MKIHWNPANMKYSNQGCSARFIATGDPDRIQGATPFQIVQSNSSSSSTAQLNIIFVLDYDDILCCEKVLK